MRRSIWLASLVSYGGLWVVACGSTPPAQSLPASAEPASERESQPLAAVLSNCVLHAGDAATADRSDVTPEGQDRINIESTCSYNAECVAQRGVETPGDGFVELECRTGGECSCRVERAARPRGGFQLSGAVPNAGGI